MLYENNLTYFLFENSLRKDNRYFYGMYKYGKNILNKEIELNANKNIWKDNFFDISEYISKEKGVLYKINVSFSDYNDKMSLSEHYSSGNIEKLLIPTNLAMSIKKLMIRLMYLYLMWTKTFLQKI